MPWSSQAEANSPIFYYEYQKSLFEEIRENISELTKEEIENLAAPPPGMSRRRRHRPPAARRRTTPLRVRKRIRDLIYIQDHVMSATGPRVRKSPDSPDRRGQGPAG